MNDQAILELANFIEHCELEFDMSTPWAAPDCGTAGCILGHAALLWPDVVSERQDGVFSCDDTCLSQKVEIKELTIAKLCYPSSAVCDYDGATAEDAADVLRHLAETGEVDWKRVDRKTSED